MGYSVVLQALAAEAVFQTAKKRVEETGSIGDEPEAGIGEVLVDIAASEGVPLDRILRRRQDRELEAILVRMRARTDEMERGGKALVEVYKAIHRLTWKAEGGKPK
jgi:hypothetical protein